MGTGHVRKFQAKIGLGCTDSGKIGLCCTAIWTQAQTKIVITTQLSNGAIAIFQRGTVGFRFD